MINKFICGVQLIALPVLIFANCSPHEFQCDSTTCIPNSELCDNNFDCTDMSDELPANCPDSDKCSSTCTEGQYQCTDCACVTDQTHCYVISSTEDPNQETSGDTNQQASTVSASPVLNKDTWIIYTIVCTIFLPLLVVTIIIVVYCKKNKKINRVGDTEKT